MSYEIRPDYDQVFAFPPALEHWVTEDHPARFIREFVDALDLMELGFPCRTAWEGRPNYSSELLVKAWLYAYFNKIRSPRKLAAACHENVGLLWLLGLHAPCYHTLWRFWSENQKAIRGIFKKSVLVAYKANLVDLALHAVDGTKVMAASSRRTMWHKKNLLEELEKLDEAINEVMTQTEGAQASESGEYRLSEEMTDKTKRKKAIEEALAELATADREHMHPLEPDAELMKNGGKIELSYNAQAVVDQKNQIIVAAKVVTAANDVGQLVPMLKEVEENLGQTAEETLGDGGYWNPEQLALAEEQQYEVLTKPGSAERPVKGRDGKTVYHSSEFTYDEEHDRCVCPHGQFLTYQGTKQHKSRKHLLRVYRCRSFRECPFRSECSRDRRGRTIEIGPYHKVAVRQREKRKEPGNKEKLKARNGIVEPVFAWMKTQHGFKRCTVVGLEKVQTQWSMMCATINLYKLYQFWTRGKLELRTV